jgi:phytanoyl-CoA hydroxylase
MLSQAQREFYEEHGYLHVPEVFSSEEIGAMEEHLQVLLKDWAQTDIGWTGPWRKAYMDEETEKQSKLTHLHDLHFYSDAWSRAMHNPRLVGTLVDLLGPNVELHHTTLHLKPPETGHPFPLHQDDAFYSHEDGRYIDVLVHLDDTRHENGEIRFTAGSHKAGRLPHITETPEGPCTPHLPVDRYRLEDTVPAPARRGDIVLFNIFTIHGSHINQTDRMRRLVRCGFRDPANRQLDGQSVGRPGIMVHGLRPCAPGQKPFPEEAIA